MAIITMGGLSGGGARALGPLVAEKISADYVDRLILADIARHVGATVEALHQREERPPTRGERFTRILQRILERSAVTGAGGDPYFGPGISTYLTEEYEDLPQPTITRGHELEDEKYFEAVTSVMKDLAARDNVVFVGRGGHIILKDFPGVLRVGVVARIEDRVETIMARERLSEEDAQKTITARDLARSAYFKSHFDVETPDDPGLYHLTINTSEVDLEFASELVIQSAHAMQDDRLQQKVGVPA
jgi:cytidylate kinase